jgi:hypothetical protein
MTNLIQDQDAAENRKINMEFENGELPPAFLEMLRIEPDSRLAHLFRGETSDNRGTHDSALAYSLLPCGFTDNEISAVLWCNKHGRVWTNPYPDEYIAQAIAIARLSPYIPAEFRLRISRANQTKIEGII